MNSVFVAAASGFIWSYWMTSGASHLLWSPAARVPPDFLMWWFDGCVFVLPFEFGKKLFICQLFVDPVFF